MISLSDVSRLMKRQTHQQLAAGPRNGAALVRAANWDGCGAGFLPALPQASRLHPKAPCHPSLPKTRWHQVAIVNYLRISLCSSGNGTPQPKIDGFYARKFHFMH